MLIYNKTADNGNTGKGIGRGVEFMVCLLPNGGDGERREKQGGKDEERKVAATS